MNEWMNETWIFQEGYSKRHVFSRRFQQTDRPFYYLIEQILIFPETLFSPRTHTNFPGASFFSSNRYSFSRKPYLVLKHLRFSRRPYLVLEHIQFSRWPLCLEHKAFSRKVPLLNRYFVNRSRWLLSGVSGIRFS